MDRFILETEGTFAPNSTSEYLKVGTHLPHLIAF